jgi:hypothetical protein
MNVYVHMHAHTHTYMYIFFGVHLCVCVCVCARVRACVCVCFSKRFQYVHYLAVMFFCYTHWYHRTKYSSFNFPHSIVQKTQFSNNSTVIHLRCVHHITTSIIYSLQTQLLFIRYNQLHVPANIQISSDWWH